LIVDVSDHSNPEVVGPVPDAVPGVGNGIEGIEANGDVLVIDQREPLGDPPLGFDVPENLPARGLAIYDISDPSSPELAGRYDYGELTTHTVSLWRDPEDSDRLLAILSFTDNPDIQVLDLTGCPDNCNPTIVANWDLETQVTPPNESHPSESPTDSTHEAIMSTDGRRIYVSQLQGGVFMLDSTNLLRSLREGIDCDPSAPEDTPGERHCLTLLNPEIDAREDTAPPLIGAWHHTPIKIPDRPYLLETSESTGPGYDAENDEILTANCPGALTRLIYIGEDQFYQDPEEGGTLLRGDLDPETVGVFGLPEQELTNCGEDGWESDEVALPAWFSPHDALVFPNIAFVTYYGAGFRAIDISNPYMPVETGYFFNDPVEEVRWASYGIQGETVTEDGEAVRRPAPGQKHMFAFSYPVMHDGHIIYADVHSGLYILKYSGPHADEIPEEGNCISGNPGAVKPGFEPCPPYGETDWGTPGYGQTGEVETAEEDK
jgi:hypothetical protein